jgi:hypothetical protein
MHMVMNLRFPKKGRGSSWPAERLTASQEVLCFIELVTGLTISKEFCSETWRWSDKNRSGQPIMGGPPVWGLGERPTHPRRKSPTGYRVLHRASELGGILRKTDEEITAYRTGRKRQVADDSREVKGDAGKRTGIKKKKESSIALEKTCHKLKILQGKWRFPRLDIATHFQFSQHGTGKALPFPDSSSFSCRWSSLYSYSILCVSSRNQLLR